MMMALVINKQRVFMFNRVMDAVSHILAFLSFAILFYVLLFGI